METVQRDGICVEVLAPAPGSTPSRPRLAQRIALRIAKELDVTGLLAVEMFATADGGLLVNELAMRPHNSGHWTIEGARTSQFEQHLRAVLDLPLGSPSLSAPVVVMANLLGGDDPDIFSGYEHVMAHDPGIKIHFYGKEVRPGRKIGHVTAFGTDLARSARARAASARRAGHVRLGSTGTRPRPHAGDTGLVSGRRDIMCTRRAAERGAMTPSASSWAVTPTGR